MELVKVRIFQQKIIDYWMISGRKSLPWRTTIDPWQILIAEILLRKTTSNQAAQVYNQLNEFTPSELANIDDAVLQTILEPIGLYRVRSTQLRNIAAQVNDAGVEELANYSFVRALPGVGAYIANTVHCFAYNVPKPALDTNMIRVIERVFGWKSSKSRPRDDRELWALAETLVPEDKCKEFNWGVLDLGAAICTARNPHCSICPLNQICLYSLERSSNQP